MSTLLRALAASWRVIAALAVTSAAYLVGVIPAEGGFGDVTVVQWLGLVVFLGASFGITQSAQNAVPRQDADKAA